MIDRYLIRYFLAVVDNGTFSRAAERVNVSQPALSVAVAKLERHLGTELFHRSNRRIHLTDAGARFLPHARRIESEFNRAESSLQGIQPMKQLRLGILNTIPSAIIAPAIGQMLKADANMRVEVVERSERELVNQVARERVDVALTLVERGGDRFGEEVLFEEGYVAVLPEDHPCAGQAVLNAEDLADSVMIVRRHCEALSETSRYFTERGVRPFFAYRSSNDDRVMAMIAAGLGLTIMPASHTAPGAWRAQMAGFDLKRHVGFMFGAGVDAEEINAMSGFKAFRRTLVERASTMLAPVPVK
ncbi:MAG: LysR family transcriptional regulator [Hyphomonadaceae bacterium]|nr:LysR family transcriptional regulator [Hyphomonadaceae bacterium]